MVKEEDKCQTAEKSLSPDRGRLYHPMRLENRAIIPRQGRVRLNGETEEAGDRVDRVSMKHTWMHAHRGKGKEAGIARANRRETTKKGRQPLKTAAGNKGCLWVPCRPSQPRSPRAMFTLHLRIYSCIHGTALRGKTHPLEHPATSNSVHSWILCRATAPTILHYFSIIKRPLPLFFL